MYRFRTARVDKCILSPANYKVEKIADGKTASFRAVRRGKTRQNRWMKQLLSLIHI